MAELKRASSSGDGDSSAPGDAEQDPAPETETKIERRRRTRDRARDEQRMFEKLDSPNFMADVRPLLAADAREAFDEAAAEAAFTAVFGRIIRLMPGAAWALTPEMIARFELAGL